MKAYLTKFWLAEDAHRDHSECRFEFEEVLPVLREHGGMRTQFPGKRGSGSSAGSGRSGRGSGSSAGGVRIGSAPCSDCIPPRCTGC